MQYMHLFFPGELDFLFSFSKMSNNFDIEILLHFKVCFLNFTKQLGSLKIIS
jgi:hypothetical protein